MSGAFSKGATRARRIAAAAGTVLALFAVVWHFWLSTPWTIRIPRDWKLVADYVGTQTFPDPKTGVLPDRDDLGTYRRALVVTDVSQWPNSVVLEDRYEVRDLKTKAITFQYVTRETVDPRTGAWSEGPHKGEIVVFPTGVEKRTYTMRSSFVKGVPLAFSGEEDIDGLRTFVFSYRGPAEYTESYAGTPEFPGVPVPAGQEIRCADDQFYYRVWVEPRTGAQVKLEEGCPSGDYLYDIATNRRFAAVDRFSGETSGDNLMRRVSEVYRARRAYMWAAVYFPVGLLALSVALLGWALFSRGAPAKV